jgi:hypothetical protein
MRIFMNVKDSNIGTLKISILFLVSNLIKNFKDFKTLFLMINLFLFQEDYFKIVKILRNQNINNTSL